MKSIMEPKGCKTCYACGREGIDLEVHHIFYGTANRRLSEKYGLKVHLCIRRSARREYGIGPKIENCSPGDI